MPFSANPLVPGDLFEAARRLSARADDMLSGISAPTERQSTTRALWADIVGLGWHAVLVPETCGGAGGSINDAAALAEGLGRSAFALSSASVCAVVPALLGGSSSGGQKLLTEFATGAARPIAAIENGFGEGHGFSARRPANTSDGVGVATLSGEFRGVDYLPGATHLVLACTIEGEKTPTILRVDLTHLAVSLRHHERMDRRPTVDIAFNALTVSASDVLAQGSLAGLAIDRALTTGTLLVCAEAIGCMTLLLEQTIEYLSKRVQFGAPLSSLQALRHRVAELYVSYEHSRAMVEHVLRLSESGNIPARELDLTKMRLSEVARRFAATVTQLHGGMGVSDELPASRLCKRLFMLNFEFRNAAELEASLKAINAA